MIGRASSMQDSWTTSRIDLLLELPPGRGRRAGLEQALRNAIRDGRLRPGSELPSTRVLARDLSLARGTVVEAYDQLITEGYLTARGGSGTRVAHAPRVAPAARAESAKAA